jgi:hypothetical protein
MKMRSTCLFHHVVELGDEEAAMNNFQDQIAGALFASRM